MRVNTQKVWAAFLAGKSLRQCDAIWTNGDHIYSYGTCLLVRDKTLGYILNLTKYSHTTSCQQSGLRMCLHGTEYATVSDLPRGCSADYILTAYLRHKLKDFADA